MPNSNLHNIPNICTGPLSPQIIQNKNFSKVLNSIKSHRKKPNKRTLQQLLDFDKTNFKFNGKTKKIRTTFDSTSTTTTSLNLPSLTLTTKSSIWASPTLYLVIINNSIEGYCNDFSQAKNIILDFFNSKIQSYFLNYNCHINNNDNFEFRLVGNSKNSIMCWDTLLDSANIYEINNISRFKAKNF